MSLNVLDISLLVSSVLRLGISQTEVLATPRDDWQIMRPWSDAGVDLLGIMRRPDDSRPKITLDHVTHVPPRLHDTLVSSRLQ